MVVEANKVNDCGCYCIDCPKKKLNNGRDNNARK